MTFLATPSARSLIAFAALCVLPALSQGLFRTSQVLMGKARATSFPADKEHGGPPAYQRLRRVHANCVENLPPYATLILVAAVSGRTDLTDDLAMPFLALRLAQSSVHAMSTRSLAIIVRATFYLGQVAIMLTMAQRLWTA